MNGILKILFIISLILFSPSAFAQGVVGHSNQGAISKPPKPPKPRLTVDGYSESLNLNFSDRGENRQLSISTNQGTPTVTNTPYWITVSNISGSSITVRCDANNSINSREGNFEIKAGKLSVTVYVSQPSGVFSITKCDFRNSTNSDYGTALYASDIRYLTPRITYNGAGSTQNKTLYVKVIKSDGKLSTGTNSPSGYSYKQDVTFYAGSNKTMLLSGWGNESSSTYGPGLTKFEIYCDGNKIYTGTVYLLMKDNESTELKVNGQTYLCSSIDAGGGTYTYNVSTDAQYWHISNVPSFCEVTNQTKTSFTLKFKPNTGGERSGNLYVETDNQKVTVSVKQAAGSGIKINRVWTDYNTYNGGQKGMTIHVEFESEGLKGHKLCVCAFFYHQNGDKLTGYSHGRYVTPGGQATVQETTTSSYDNSIWKDFTLFMPYSELPTGSVPCKYHVQIKDDITNKWSEDSDYQYFK